LSVWVTIPSARPVAEVAKWAAAWRERGYRIALWRDFSTPAGMFKRPVDGPLEGTADIVMGGATYPGYAVAVNSLVRVTMQAEPDPEWFIIAGDDVYPDPNHTAEEIAAQCREHFNDFACGCEVTCNNGHCGTFGVMQPTGDRWGENPNHARPDMRSAYIDRIAGSAWYGREYCKRVNQGRGPLWPEYQHMFVDEEARAVAVRLGVYWERRDLTQLHMHPGRAKNYTVDMIPEHLKKWASADHWKEAEQIFFRRRREGFPGSEPL
jgi:hypothetical protein